MAAAAAAAPPQTGRPRPASQQRDTVAAGQAAAGRIWCKEYGFIKL